MAESDKDQRTEPATPKRIEEAFAKGQFARSPDVAIAFTIAAGLVTIVFAAMPAARDLGEFAAANFRNLGGPQLRGEHLLDRGRTAAGLWFHLVGPLLAAVVGAAIVAGGLQTRFRLTPKVIEAKWEKLNPIAGLKRTFSAQTLINFPLDVLKLCAIAGAVWLGARVLLRDPLFHVPMEPIHLGRMLHRTALTFLGWVTLAMGAIAGLSYAYQRIKTARDLRMTKQEVKDELKNQEGDPLVKGHRRRLARRLLQKQMLAAVPTADVVVTNPTHYAVALKYERGKDTAPVVLAKGQNRFALRLRALAQEHGVPVVENKPVARFLYGVGQVGEPVPLEIYQAVAEILAFVYRTHRYYFHQLRARRVAAAARAIELAR